MIGLLGCPIPHHVQMFFDHVYSAYVHNGSIGEINEQFVDTVYQDSMTGLRGHPELSHMEERLRVVLEPERFNLALTLLTEAAVAGKLTNQAANTICTSHLPSEAQPRQPLLNILHILEHDGYLVLSDGAYVFVSRLVRDWWKRRFGFGYHPVKDGE
jgi:hypothetical protein